MKLYDKTLHQKRQIKVIDEIERQVDSHSLNSSTVEPVQDYENDNRICLTGIHLLEKELINKINKQIINPLQSLFPEHYYYPDDAFHATIKSVRVVHDPPLFSEAEIKIAKDVFAKVVKRYHPYYVYYFKLIIFPVNLVLIGTTDEEHDSLILDLNHELEKAGIPDDKIYSNNKYFFSNITLARFTSQPKPEFVKKVEELSTKIYFPPYEIDSVTLLTCNAVVKKKNIIAVWQLNRFN